MKQPHCALAQQAVSASLNLSEDGYVRMTLLELKCIPMHHLCSGLDEGHPGSSAEGASTTELRGYTEWVSQTRPALSVGWDWQFNVMDGTPHCVLIGQPYSNVMLQDGRRGDLGQEATIALLALWTETLGWQEVTKSHITQRYA